MSNGCVFFRFEMGITQMPELRQPQRSASDLIMHEFHFHCLKVVDRFALVTLVLFFFPSPIRNWAKLTLITLECVSVCTVQIRN